MEIELSKEELKKLIQMIYKADQEGFAGIVIGDLGEKLKKLWNEKFPEEYKTSYYEDM